MMSVEKLELWNRHFGYTDFDRTADDVWMVAKRLDEAADILVYSRKYLDGCPDDDLVYDLRVALTCVQDSFESLRDTVRLLRSTTPAQVD